MLSSQSATILFYHIFFFYTIFSWHWTFLNFILFFYLWLRWVFVAVRELSLVAASGGYSSLRCSGFSLQWLLLLQSTGSRRTGFSSCSTQAQQLWCMGFVAPRHVGSSRTRDQTRVPCIGRRILNHCATKEVPLSHILIRTNITTCYRSHLLSIQLLYSIIT